MFVDHYQFLVNSVVSYVGLERDEKTIVDDFLAKIGGYFLEWVRFKLHGKRSDLRVIGLTSLCFSHDEILGKGRRLGVKLDLRNWQLPVQRLSLI